MMTVERYVPGTPPNGAARAIADMMRDFDTGKSYADMMRYRICGAAADECNDTYYVAYREQKALSRLWMGWGRHRDAIGNWGNFFTVEYWYINFTSCIGVEPFRGNGRITYCCGKRDPSWMISYEMRYS